MIQLLARSIILGAIAAGMVFVVAAINLQIVKKPWNWLTREIVGMIWTFSIMFVPTGLLSVAWPRLVPWSQAFFWLWGNSAFVMAVVTVFIPNERRRLRRRKCS